MPIVRARAKAKASTWLFSFTSADRALAVNLLPRIRDALIARDGLESHIISFHVRSLSSLSRRQLTILSSQQGHAQDSNGDIVEAVHRFFQSPSNTAGTRLLVENAIGQDPARLSGVLSAELSHEMRIEALITVISPSAFLSNIQKKDRREGEEGGTVAEAAIEEVEFADVLLFISSDDPLQKESEQSCRDLLSQLNPGAVFIDLPSSLPTTFDLTSVCAKALFGLDTTAEKAGWSKALEAAPPPLTSSEASSSHQHPSSPPGTAGCFTFRSRRPFHPQRLRHLLHSQLLSPSTSEAASNEHSLGQIVRSRGIAWVSGPRSQHCSEWHQSGPSFHLESMGPWFKLIPRELWLEGQNQDEAIAEIEKDFADGSDERNELVFIGLRINERALSQALESCLCTDEEMKVTMEEVLDDDGTEPWPSVDVLIEEMREQRLQAASGTLEEVEEEEEEEEERLDVVKEEGGEEDLNQHLVSWQPGKVYEVALGAPEAQELVNQAEAALSSLSPPLPLLVVIDWHATWAVACKKDVPRLDALASKHPLIVFMRIRIPADERGPNAALAREKVMDRPFSRRTCNRPIPRSGGKWPVYTTHLGPTLHPDQTTSKGDGQPWMGHEGGSVDEGDEMPLTRVEAWATLKAAKLLPHDDGASTLISIIRDAIKPSSVPVPPPRAPASSAISPAAIDPSASTAAKSGVGASPTKGSGSMPRAIPKGWWSGQGGSKKGIIASRSKETALSRKQGQAEDDDEDGEEGEEDGVGNDEGMSLSTNERAMLKKLGLVRTLKRGAVDFKAHLHAHSSEASSASEVPDAGGRKKVLIVAWVPSSYKDSAKLARELDSIALEVWSSSLDPSAPPPDVLPSQSEAPPIVLVADVGASNANTLLAKALLKQEDPESTLSDSGPIFHLYSGMKLSKVVKGGLGSIHQLQKAVRQLTMKEGEAEAQSRAKEDSTQAWSQPSSAFLIKLAPAGCPYDPPQGKEAVAGSQRMFTAKGQKGGQVTGLYWPKMPCLSCGCPWWQGEDWDARCVRCGWDCETDGYDDDSRPLPEYRARFEAFSSAIKQGRVAEYRT